MLRAFSRRREDRRVNEIALIKDKLRGFGGTGANPVKDQIAELRADRASGVLSDIDYAIEVAALLGSPDGPGEYLAGRTRAV
jgi:hypothetical protein